MDLTPDILRTFVAAAQALNFTQAAKQLNRTQSGVSLQMSRLEESLGKQLFQRMPRGVKLTGEGKSLLKYAHRMLKLHNEALASIKAPAMSGCIRLGIPEDYAELHLPGILKRVAETFPLIQMEIFCDMSPGLREMMEGGKLDLCLANLTDMDPPEGNTFLRREPLIWIGPENAEPEREAPIPLAVFHHGCIYRKWAIHALNALDIPHRIVCESPSMACVLAAVEAGHAVAPVGASTPVSRFRIIPEPLLPGLPSAMVHLIHRTGSAGNIALHHVARFISDEFRTTAMDKCSGIPA